MLRVVQEEAARVEFAGVLDEIVRDGARRMLAAALESEVTPTWPRPRASATTRGMRS